MKLACQTIIWGRRINDIDRVLDQIQALGFQGVEIAQRADKLHRDARFGIDDLLSRLEARNLHLLGLAGGSLERRMEFCGDARPEYLYVESVDQRTFDLASSRQFTLALHPHMYKETNRLEKAIRLLREYTGLKFILDTAHLLIAGDDPVGSVAETKQYLVALHLKDWSRRFGRAPHRYARGFCELGEGDVPLTDVMQALNSEGYAGWVVIEQDHTLRSPAESLKRSVAWLSRRGSTWDFLGPRPLNDSNSTSFSQTDPSPLRASPHRTPSPALLRIRPAEVTSSHELYSRIAESLYCQFHLQYAAIWSCSADSNLLVLVGSMPEQPVADYTWPASRALCGAVLEEKDVVHFDLNSDLSRCAPREFCGQHAKETFNLSHMVSVPVFNSANCNHVRFVLNLFASNRDCLPVEEDLAQLAEDVCDAVDAYLDDQCLIATTHVHTVASQHRGLEGFLGALGEHVKRIVRCEGITIFLADPSDERLKVGFTSGIHWNAHENFQFYLPGEGLTGSVFLSKRPLITPRACDEPGHKGKSSETVSSTHDACLLVPMLDEEGDVTMLVRCRNKEVNGTVQCFTDDDVSLLESIGAAALPYVKIAMSRLHSRALTVMAHEFKAPVVAIRNLSEEFIRLLGQPTEYSLGTLAPDLRDLQGWAQVMRRVVKNVEFLKTSAEPLKLSPVLVHLAKDVIEPVVPCIRLLMRSRRFPQEKVFYEKAEDLPALRVDRELMEQVFFHLLWNAVKYGPSLAENFRVDVTGMHSGGMILITVSDWGIGIPEANKEDVFEEGFRCPEVVARDVTGHGIGLWIVRQVVESHGGRAYIASVRDPTQITIELPKAQCDYREWLSGVKI